MDFHLARYRCHLLAKGLTPTKVSTVLTRIAENPEKWLRKVAKWTQRDAHGEWKVLAREAVDALVDESLPGTSMMCVSVRSLMLLGLRADAAFYLMCAIIQACGGNDDYIYHYVTWDWLEEYLEQPVNGRGLFGEELHNKIK